jgi:hypothetical protein
MAAKAAGHLDVGAPRGAVELMLAEMGIVKMRAAFEPHISGAIGRQSIVEWLLDISSSSPSGEVPLATLPRATDIRSTHPLALFLASI